MLSEKLIHDSILEDQITLETQAVRQGVIRYRRLAEEAIRRGDGAALKPAERLLLHWFEPLVHAIRREKRAIRRGEPDVGRGVYGPWLLRIDAERAAVVTMHEAVGQCMAHLEGVPVVKLAHSIGRAIFAELNHDALRKERVEYTTTLGRLIRFNQVRALSQRVRSLDPINVNWWAKKVLDDPNWERRVCVHLGVRLIWLLIEVASCADYDEAFKLAFEYKTIRDPERPHKTIRIVRMSDAAMDIIDQGHSVRQHMRPRYLPMIVPPYPWQPGCEGGYVRIRTPFISKPTGTQKAALAAADLSQVYDCLNAINATPWRINRRILNLVKTVWAQGGGMLGIPHRDDFAKPPLPADFATNPEAKEAWKRDAFQVYERNKQLKGLRKDFLNKLAVAEEMAERPSIWFPHQFDFRGRAYPIPPFLNHQGDDVCRGLLEFAEARPITPRAKFWLLVHAANCYGVDKCSYDERVEWVQDNWAHINRAVANPLDNEWWMQADKPWQFLAACFALLDDEAAQHIPVQIDGTCNGLQHYAAMGRDAEGAAVVNLLPGDRPADVYSDVGRLTARLVQADATAGKPEAVLLANHIDRAVVKQPVMTSVYGVTMVGAREQVYEKLDKLGVTDIERYRASMYLSRLVLKAMKEACPGAARIMAWLRSLAKIVADKQKQPVAWTTPLGFPVVQPYRNYRKAQVKTILQDVTMLVEDETMPPSVSRQMDGIAPNFVHSIDATHMMMTARECRRHAIAFAAVHDSYWTHAADVDTMAHLLREQFVALHSRPLLNMLRDELAAKHPDATFPDPPEPGSLDLTVVYESKYLFN